MLYWAFVFFVVALIAGLAGFGGVMGTAAGLAQALCLVFLGLFVVTLILVIARRPPSPTHP